VSSDSQIMDLVSNFRNVMEAHNEHLKCFCAYGVQLEGWLKGELMHFLDQQKSMTNIVDFDREEPAGKGRKKVDFRLEFPGEAGTRYTWLEIKHWLIGYQKGCKYDALFYFSDPSSVGIAPDIKKLATIQDDHKYLLVLATANPGEIEWLTGVDRFNHKFAPPSLKPVTNPKGFPNYYFLGLLKVDVKV